jgi:hypothetical protein
MRTDDPRLEAGRKVMEERVKSFNALMLNVIQGHIVIEQALDSFLAASFSNPEHVADGQYARFTHSNKIQMCRAASFNEVDDGLWKVIWAVNTLRNKIAHGADAEEIAKKMAALRKEYFAILTDKQVAGLKTQSNDYIAQSACVTAAGFIWTIEADARARRKVVDEQWKPEN